MSEIRKERARQARRVLPLLGPLADDWDGMPNDVKSDLAAQCPGFVARMDALIGALENAAPEEGRS